MTSYIMSTVRNNNYMFGQEWTEPEEIETLPTDDEIRAALYAVYEADTDIPNPLPPEGLWYMRMYVSQDENGYWCVVDRNVLVMIPSGGINSATSDTVE